MYLSLFINAVKFAIHGGFIYFLCKIGICMAYFKNHTDELNKIDSELKNNSSKTHFILSKKLPSLKNII